MAAKPTPQPLRRYGFNRLAKEGDYVESPTDQRTSFAVCAGEYARKHGFLCTVRKVVKRNGDVRYRAWRCS